MSKETAASDRRAKLGRAAGVLFLAGGVASLPADMLLPDPPDAVFYTDALAFVSGAVCLALPWRRAGDWSLHALAAAATAEVTLGAVVSGGHESIFLWYFLLVAIFAGYVFPSRAATVAHLGLILAGVLLTAILGRASDPDAYVRVLVAGPSLCLGAGVVAWLREGVEASHARLAAMAEMRRVEALTDALTGLPNRRRLLVDLDAALHDGEHTLALYDLDGFKAYNDAHGHLAGDALLTRLAERLGEAIEELGGTAYRLGGDEFCVLVAGTGLTASAAVGAGVDALASEREEAGIGCSAGHAALPADAATASAALSTADRRMYACKGARARSATAR